MAIEAYRRCEPIHVTVLLSQLASWHRQAEAPFHEESARASLLGLTRDPALGTVWLIEHRGRVVGYAVVEKFPARGFLWREAELAAMFLDPDARDMGIGRGVRQVLRELLMGEGHAMIPTDSAEDRCWPRLGYTPDVILMTAAA